MSVITSLSWISKGFAKLTPVQQDIDLEAMKQKHIEEEEDLDMEEDSMPAFADVEYDPELEGQEDDEEEKEDMLLEKDDALIVAGVQNGDLSEIHVYVYVENTGALYVHHDIIVGAYPISLQWLPYNPASPAEVGNCLAVGSFTPGIEVWDLDVLDTVEPVKTLGGVKEGSGQGKKKRKKEQLKKGSHHDAVICLDLHPTHKNILASGSADCTVKIWDIIEGNNKVTHSHHEDKVQAVRWNPQEEKFLATGGFDKSVYIVSADNSGDKLKFQTRSDVESIRWNPFDPLNLVATTESGQMLVLDARRFDTPVHMLQAHRKQCTSAFSPGIPGLLATASTDETVKVWDLSQGAPQEFTQKEMNVGELFCCEFSQDNPWTLTVGGTEGVLAIWDTEESGRIAEHFAGRQG